MQTVDQQSTALTQSEQASGELSEMAEELKNSTDIGKSAEAVAAASEELSSAVEEINRAAAQIMAAIEQINRGAQQQAAATQQSSAALAQIERAAQIASERATAALHKGGVMTEALQSNRAAVDQMIVGVQQAVEDGNRAREQINALEQVARRIDKIVDAITTVSIQTNMLAVNGSIEAARAGEFGKGFMVVSTDIRNLARDSSENAERIKDLVKSVQDQIVAVRRDLEEIAAAAATEVEKNKAVTANLGVIERDMAVILTGSKEINAGATEILASLGEAKQAVEQIAAAAQQAAQASDQAAQAAREQSKGAEELAGAVEEIASLADELQSSEG
jgi:methyl-accepting chemotaxis protein